MASTGATAGITVPTRYGSAPAWSERFARPILALAGPGARIHGDELAARTSALLQRDEPAAELVRAVR
jgi:hypothetical protein